VLTQQHQEVKEFVGVLCKTFKQKQDYFDLTPGPVLCTSFRFYQTYGVFPPQAHPRGLEIFMDELFEEEERQKEISYKTHRAEILELGKQQLKPLEIGIISGVRPRYVITVLQNNGLMARKRKRKRQKGKREAPGAHQTSRG
jgi:hypothetical protein